MYKKITSLFLAVMYLIMCANIVSFAADAYIDGPEILYTPMDSSYTSLTYLLKEESGEIVDDSLVSWSAEPSGLIILENGEIILNKETPTGNYTISAYDGDSVFTKQVTVVEGAYEDFSAQNEGYMTAANRIPVSGSVVGAKGDFVVDFDYKYDTGVNAVALYITTKDLVNDYSLPMHIRSNADKYLIRFLHYEGGITRANKDYVVQKNYGEWSNVKIYIRCVPATDSDVEHLVYDVYSDNELIFENLRPANTTATPYDGFRTCSIRQSGFHVDNFKVHSGLPIDTSDNKYKYIGLNINGEDTVGTPRNNEPVYVSYDITNMFGSSVSGDAEWSVSPSSSGLSVSDNGVLCVTKEALEGVYTLSAVIDGNEYTKEITLSTVDYNLVVNGDSSYKKDHTFEGKSFIYEAADQFGTPVKVSWELIGNSNGVLLSQTDDSSCELYVLSDAAAGTYSVKAIADPSENMSISEYVKTLEVTTATYAIYGSDLVKKPSSEFETHTYTLRSEIGNDVSADLEWKCDNIPLIKNGIMLVDSSAPNSAEISVLYNNETYSKTISLSSTTGDSGEVFNGNLWYNGPESMSLLADVTDMKLEAVLMYGASSDIYRDIEWNVVGLSGDVSVYPENVYINDSRLYVKGKKLGSVSIQGKMNKSTLTTDAVTINLKEAFTSLDGSKLTVKGTNGEEINVYHYMPAEGNFYESLSATSSIPEQDNVEITSNANSAEVNLDLYKTGMHKIVVEKESGEVNEYTVFINSDKLFEQPNLATLLADPSLEEYLKLYSNMSDDMISNITGIISVMDSSDIDKLALLSRNNKSLFPASVLMLDLLKGNKDVVSSLKAELEANNFNSAWLDVYVKDSKFEALNSIVYSGLVSINNIDELVILTAVEKCNSANSKEIKPYLALIDNNKYKGADTSGKNYIASKVAGKAYSSLDDLSEAIDSVVIPSSSGGSGGSSSGGGSKYQSGTIGSISPSAPSVQTPETNLPTTKSYKDVTSDHWAFEYVNHLSDKGIINGYDNNTFMPENNVTRAEFLKILVSAFGIGTNAISANFEDVNNSDWFAPYVYSAVEKSLVQGDGVRFNPNEFISRQDAAVMIYRFLNYSGVQMNNTKVEYSDNVEILSYAADSVYSLSNLGIIAGMPNGSFAPASNTTRAEAAKMIYLAMDKGGVR